MEGWERIVDHITLPLMDQKVFIWGAGNTSVLNHQGMLRENLYEELRVAAFLDSRLAGSMFHGFSVYSPDILQEGNPDEYFVFISTTNCKVFREIEGICKSLKISCCLMDAAILKVRKRDFSFTQRLFDIHSQEIYSSLLMNRVEAKSAEPDLYTKNPYFGITEFCRPDPNDVIVDCGAYVGDTAERYIWQMEMFKKYIAIDPGADNFHAMEERFLRLRKEWNLAEDKLTAIYGGVDEFTHKLNIESRVAGLGSIAKCETDDVDQEKGVTFWKVDDLMPGGYTFLKADIESYEYRMLCGAKKTIQKYHPRMAICIYHNMVDMFSIPQLIHQIEPQYRLSVRHHSYGYEETVLYAY